MKLRYPYILVLFILLGCSGSQVITSNGDNSPQTKPTFTPFETVNPFIGTGGHGHTYPGATVPFGMVQLSPDTRLEGWDGCSGYHYSDSIVYGFSHTHLQGTGVADYCDILFMPTNHKLKVAEKWNDAYKSSFSHKKEEASPGYYKVHLDDYNIDAEFTTTERTGIHKYNFAQGDSCRLFIDMMHRDELRYYDIQTSGDTAVFGYRVSKGWAEEQHCYFYAVFSKPFHDFTQLDISYDEKNQDGQRKIVYEQVQVFSMLFDPTDEITVKVGISGVDCEGAKANLYAEAPHWDFDLYRKQARSKWEACFEKARIEESDFDEMAKYYTALYHCYTVPNLWSDVDGRYRGEDKKIHTAKGYKRYTVFSLWDTFRAYHPLMSELEPEITRDWIVTFLEIFKQRGELPVWELAGNETYCMIGYHSVPVILDAYRRGITDFDHQLALRAMVTSATGPQEEKRAYDLYGYVPSERFSESVSKTLEFAYDDWCIAQFAKDLGDMKTYERFIIRAQNWKNIFDPETGFMRPRRNGGFPSPFDPYQVDFNFTEANSWQYSFFVPHDILTLMEYHGGQRAFSNKVEELFHAAPKTTGREQSDITGLIGQYAHGNEPSHHAAFLYNYGAPCYEPSCYATKKTVDQIMKEMYTNAPDGLCGNEDCGQMSAWYVLAKNNLYSLCPGNPEFVTFQPYAAQKSEHTIGTKHIVEASETINSRIEDFLIVPAPVILGPQTSFANEAKISSFCTDTLASAELLVITGFDDPQTGELNETHQMHPFKNKTEGTYKSEKNIEVTASATREGYLPSKEVHALYRRNNMNMTMMSSTPYDNQYTGGGTNAMIDGVHGGEDFRTGAWQGWRGTNAEMIVDLGTEKPITTVGVSCLEEIKSWIWFPSLIEVSFSHDGKTFGSPIKITHEEPTDSYVPRVKEFTTNVRASGRYVKFTIHPAFTSIPSWHLGAGDKCWIFADELIVK